MSEKSTIEWTDATWNPVRGCTKISAGCAHCYAETFAERFRGVPGHPYEQGFDLRLVPEKLCEPLRWSRPKMIFVNSMSDLLHKDVSDAYVGMVAEVMRIANWHTYQVLTLARRCRACGGTVGIGSIDASCRRWRRPRCRTTAFVAAARKGRRFLQIFRTRGTSWFIRRKRAPQLKKADMLIPLGVA